MFIGFANFYQRFLWNFSKIVILLTLLLKTTISLDFVLKAFKANDMEVVEISDRANETLVNLSKNNKSKNLTCMPNIGATVELNFSIPNIKKAFNQLKLAFIKVLILKHFDLKSYI